MASKTLSEFMNVAHPAYTTTVRRGFGGHTFGVCVLTALDASVGVRLLHRFMPDMSKEDHAELARQHAGRALWHRACWSEVVDAAFMETYGRKFGLLDYKVSGIADDGLSEDRKSKLRVHAISKGLHHTLAVLHYMAAGHRHQSALTYCRSLGL